MNPRVRPRAKSPVEALGGTVRLVECPRENFKVTTPDDLRLADLLLRARGRAASP